MARTSWVVWKARMTERMRIWARECESDILGGGEGEVG